MESINIKKVIKNLENSLLKCDKAIQYWEKQGSQEIEDEYKKRMFEYDRESERAERSYKTINK